MGLILLPPVCVSPPGHARDQLRWEQRNRRGSGQTGGMTVGVHFA